MVKRRRPATLVETATATAEPRRHAQVQQVRNPRECARACATNGAGESAVRKPAVARLVRKPTRSERNERMA